MRIILIVLLLLLFRAGYCQEYSLSGKILDENGKPYQSAEIIISQKGIKQIDIVSGENGIFEYKFLTGGYYYLTVSAHSYESYSDSFRIKDSSLILADIVLHPLMQMLNEVSIVQKIVAVTQKGDTTEYKSGAYKVHPNADASELLAKMPSIDINNKEVKAQGETVTTVLVDGKPFFGNDAFGSLKNLPADIIDKVQVYNEKSDQERFTGFREGTLNKTINIITKPEKRCGVFGNIYSGGGIDDNRHGTYGIGGILNRFDNQKRITVNTQFNNTNVQNFNDVGTASSESGSGIASTKGAATNYTDQWGKKMEISGNYSFSETENIVEKELRRNFVQAANLGQVYDELNLSNSKIYNHRSSGRINYSLDSSNTILWTPSFSLTNSKNYSQMNGITQGNAIVINATANQNTTERISYTITNNILYNHKFRKRGRTISISANIGRNSNNGTSLQLINSFYSSSSLNDTINQRQAQRQEAWNATANAVYTEPCGRKGQIKMQYDILYAPSTSERTTYKYLYSAEEYSSSDSLLSNSFASYYIAYKSGISYRFQTKNIDISVGLNYQFAVLRSDGQFPIRYYLRHNYTSVLPVSSANYKLSDRQNLQCQYNTSLQPPTTTQLQDVVDNTDPLHLYLGNPELKQSVGHNITIRYNSRSKNGSNSFSAFITGRYMQNQITSSTIIAQNDTSINNMPLFKGTQLTTPVNIEGAVNVNASLNYGLPLEVIKSRVNVNLDGSMGQAPAIINNHINYQYSKISRLGISLNSNISQNVDAFASINASYVSSNNSINTEVTNNYFKAYGKANINVIIGKGAFFNMAFTYNFNTGLSAGYNQNYLSWNASVGKKLFRTQKGDIRISGFDLLNKNNNIQRTISETYTQDVHTNTLQRYFMLVFTYKIADYK